MSDAGCPDMGKSFGHNSLPISMGSCFCRSPPSPSLPQLLDISSTFFPLFVLRCLLYEYPMFTNLDLATHGGNRSINIIACNNKLLTPKIKFI